MSNRAGSLNRCRCTGAQLFSLQQVTLAYRRPLVGSICPKQWDVCSGREKWAMWWKCARDRSILRFEMNWLSRKRPTSNYLHAAEEACFTMCSLCVSGRLKWTNIKPQTHTWDSIVVNKQWRTVLPVCRVSVVKTDLFGKANERANNRLTPVHPRPLAEISRLWCVFCRWEIMQCS